MVETLAMTTLEDTLARRRSRARAHDIVLWGATGYTGRLCAEYLRDHGPEELRWAIGGRSRDKLEATRRELALPETVATVVGDSGDRESLDAIASQASVVCTTVGPYARHGEGLVSACVANGTDYCDLTGEPPFIRRMIDRHHDEARRTGARIVHCCGFDSVPSDLGCFMLHEHFRDRGGGLRSATMYVGKMRGGVSGGTFASMMGIVDEARRDPTVRAIMRDAYSLNPEGEREGPDTALSPGVRRDPVRGGWTAPFVMAAINTRVVRRTNALLGYPYGRGFRYDEVMRFPDTAKGMLMATATTAGFGALAGAALFKPTRELLERFLLPAPGEGPSATTRARGMFRCLLVAEGDTANGAKESEGRVEADFDPGYGGTARMLGESALCLALDGAELDAPGGILTPAACMGRFLLRRLRERAGITFEVD